MTSNTKTNSSFRNTEFALLDIPRIEEIFWAKSGREKPSEKEERLNVSCSMLG